MLERRLGALEKRGEATEADRRRLYLDGRWLARRIAFCNPLLGFDRLLFIKRHHPGSLFHMVHQYYGFAAKPGGGIFVLHDPFGPSPRLTDLLEDAAVERGRLKGKRLTPGAFLSPDVSFDGEAVLFAYTECKAKGIEWSPRASFHIFRINADPSTALRAGGTGLVQLTDGYWNDFDPCVLPGGRIAFISERRGGYLRCGGSSPPYDSPTYTLHSMAGDGSDIRCLSFHETQEWHPSVDHNGMLVYTRWDYVDRDTNVAHHIWLCHADGRDPRAYHGNYPERRESRPWMEMSIRAVPGSHRYVAVAAP
ncbi:TolB family protein, partial [Planctomycetota bacterium]